MLAALLALPFDVWAATGTLLPSPFLLVQDVNGKPISNAKVCTYTAGTTTPATTYTDVNLTVPNTNPIRTDSAGRYVAFLAPGASYKVVYQDATGTAGNCDGATIKSVDGIAAVPGSSTGVDITGTAGEAITAGQPVYLSDGSGSKVAGQWYKGDSTNGYSSSTPAAIGMAVASILSGASGSIRIGGSLTGLTSLTVGATYYIGSAGALTVTAPTNARTIGRADTTTSMIVEPGPSATAIVTAVPVDNWICDGRLTLTTGLPVTIGDVTGATSIFFAPLRGNRCALYDGTNWNIRTFSQLTIALGTLTSGANYDVFVYDNSGTPTLELSAAWSSDTAIFGSGTYQTTRPTQDGVYVKTTNGTTIDATRRYLGTFRTTATTTTEDSYAKRFLWNYYNRVRRPMRVLETTATWTYTTATWRQANAAAANQLDFVLGVAEVMAHVTARGHYSNSTGGNRAFTNIGFDSTSSPMSNVTGIIGVSAAANIITAMNADVDDFPAIGRHTYVWLEQAEAAGAATWLGKQVTTPFYQSGIFGWIEG